MTDALITAIRNDIAVSEAELDKPDKAALQQHELFSAQVEQPAPAQ